MRKFEVDYSSLDNIIYKKSYRLDQVKDRIEKVGFDVVKFNDSDSRTNLWKVESSEDGDYIVALYEEDIIKTASHSNWEVVYSKFANALQFYYKGDAIVKIASSKLQIPVDELSKVSSYLPKKLDDNKKLVHSLLNELNLSAKKEILNRYPELG